MSAIVEVWLRSSVLLLVAFAIVGLLRRRAARVRHAVLSSSLAMTIAIGCGATVGPWWTIPVPIAIVRGATAPERAGRVPGSGAQDFSPACHAGLMPCARDHAIADAAMAVASEHRVAASTSLDLTVVWLIGVAAFAAQLGLRLIRLRRLTRSGTPVSSGQWQTLVARLQGPRRRPARLLAVAHDDVLATCGARHPRILVPRHALDWPESRVEAVLRHELAHVDRHDWAIHLAAQAVRVLYWFNPLVWVACRQLRVEAERACDEAVVRQGLPVHEYAVHLIDVARACGSAAHEAPLVSMSRGSALEGRITKMLTFSPSHLSWRAAVVVSVGLAGSGLALSTVRLSAAPQGVSGTVYDPSGGVVSGAHVTLDGPAPQHYQAETGPDGRFELTAIPPGRYKLAISLPGFKQFEDAIDLQATPAWSKTITLQLGDVQEMINVRSTRLMPRESGAVPTRVRVGGNVEPPRKTHDLRPVYPETMREAGIEGVVRLEAIIDRTGSVQSVRVLSAPVHPELARAAADAVRQWQFDPTRLNGTPVEVVMNVSIEFELER